MHPYIEIDTFARANSTAISVQFNITWEKETVDSSELLYMKYYPASKFI